jgi:molecular chaperone GrpE
MEQPANIGSSGPTDACPGEQLGETPPAPAAGDGAQRPEPDRLARLESSLADVVAELRAGHERAAARERIIDRLHEDNQRLRAGEGQLLLRPILADLQRLRNELVRETAAVPEVVSGERLAALLSSLAVSIELTLERGGVRVIRPSADEPFDPARHRAARMVPAPHPDLDGTVAEVLADGYLDTVTDRAVTPAAVLVRQWHSEETETGASEPPPATTTRGDSTDAG